MPARNREPLKHKPVLLERDNYTCVYCGEIKHRDDLEIDHLLPRILGGTHDLWNLALACQPCNNRKGTKITARTIEILNRNVRAMLVGRGL